MLENLSRVLDILVHCPCCYIHVPTDMHVLWLNGDSPVALLQTEALYIVKHTRSYYGQATLILLIIIGQMSSTDCISLSWTLQDTCTVYIRPVSM